MLKHQIDKIEQVYEGLLMGKKINRPRFHLIPHKIQVAITSKGHCDEVNHLECIEHNKQAILRGGNASKNYMKPSSTRT